MSAKKRPPEPPGGDVNWFAVVTIPTITAAKLCPYHEPRPHAKSLHDLLTETFADFKTRVAFGQLVINCGDMIDPKDRRYLCPADLPSPAGARLTKGIYSAAEVAAWWNAAREIVENWKAIVGKPVDK